MSTHVFSDINQLDLWLIIAILLGMWLLLRLNNVLFKEIGKKTSPDKRYRLMSIQPILRLFILLSGFLWILSITTGGLETDNLITILGATGLALGFAFREYISSLIAGIVTLYEGPYRPGDWIEIDGVYGEVRTVSMRSIKLLTADDILVHVPLIKLWKTPVHNKNYGSTNLMCVTEVFVKPNQHLNAEKIKNLLHRVTLSSAFTHVKKPINITMSLQIHGMLFKIKSYPIDPKDQFRYKTDLTVKAEKALRQAEIELSEFH